VHKHLVGLTPSPSFEKDHSIFTTCNAPFLLRHYPTCNSPASKAICSRVMPKGAGFRGKWGQGRVKLGPNSHEARLHGLSMGCHKNHHCFPWYPVALCFWNWSQSLLRFFPIELLVFNSWGWFLSLLSIAVAIWLLLSTTKQVTLHKQGKWCHPNWGKLAF
jgi:hypothetical protein